MTTTKIKFVPHTITDFRSMPAAKRGGRSAAEAKRVHDARQASKLPPASKRTRIYLGTAGSETIEHVKSLNPRLKNWDGSAASATLIAAGEVRTNDKGRYSSRCTYRHYTYTVLVRSWGQVFPLSRKLAFKFGDDALRVIKAPHGYRWDVDANGIRLVQIARPHADYHPTASDLMAGARHCVEQLKANLATRRRLVAEAKIAEAEAKHDAAQAKRIMAAAISEGLVVCLRDSTRAGNCEVGTVSWGQRHGFAERGHYTPAQLLAVANGDAKLVLPVIAVALRRHQNEMRQGFSLLADHGR